MWSNSIIKLSLFVIFLFLVIIYDLWMWKECPDPVLPMHVPWDMFAERMGLDESDILFCNLCVTNSIISKTVTIMVQACTENRTNQVEVGFSTSPCLGSNRFQQNGVVSLHRSKKDKKRMIHSSINLLLWILEWEQIKWQVQELLMATFSGGISNVFSL